MEKGKFKMNELVREVVRFLRENGLATDVYLYCNNKRINCETLEIKENVFPGDYMKYYAKKHIFSMTFEGVFYELINYTGGKKLDEFEKLLTKYGLYYELGNAWNLSVYPLKEEYYGDIEYTDYTEMSEEKTITISVQNKSDDDNLNAILDMWYELSSKVGDVGSCVLGAGFNFKYKGKKYFMAAASPYQGSISWEKHKDVIKSNLEVIGATEICYEWGCMD